MSITIRAVVENGTLRPIDPIDLIEGQEVEVVIVTDANLAPAALDNQLSLFSSTDD